MRTKKTDWSQLWKRNAVVAAIALFVCAAVYLHWNYGKEDGTDGGKTLGQSAMGGGETKDPLVNGSGASSSAQGAAVEDGKAAGFAALKETAPKTAEIYVMGVRPGLHRAGVGRRLFAALYRHAKGRGYAFLQVKTVQEGHYPAYDRTNAFYRAVGFTELVCSPSVGDAWTPCPGLGMAGR